MWHVGSYFPDQGSNQCSLQWEHSLNHWSAMERPAYTLDYLFILGKLTELSFE